MKLVSVVIPTFNRAYCLARTIESALGQTYPNLEVIVIDDGSTDGTAELVQDRFGSRVLYIHQPNLGVCAARNAGFQRAQGDYIALLDSDDVWSPWKIELQVACMDAHPEIGMTWTDMTGIAADGKTVISDRYMRQMYAAYRHFRNEDLFPDKYPISKLLSKLDDQIPNAFLYVGDIFSQIVIGNLVTTPTVMLSRERLAAVGGFDEALRSAGEDHDFHLRTCRSGPVGFIDVSSVYVQRDTPGQLTTECKLPLAVNYLTTLSRTLERDRERIKLTPSMIDNALASAHQWVGYSLISHADRTSEGRGHLYKSLRHQFHAKTLWYLAKSYTPRSLWPALRSFRGALRRQPEQS